MADENTPHQTPADAAPVTPLGEAVQRGQQGELPIEAVIAAFLESTVWVPSVVDPGEEGLQPVLSSPRKGETLVAVFDSGESVRAVAHLASFAVTLTGRQIVNALSDGLGLSIGTADSGFIIDPETCAQLRAASAS